ncbi:dapdiamide synthesis protein DdaC-like, partial [Saccoglossus kowalevskii]
VFGTTDKSIIRKFLADHDYEYKWDDDGSLSYWITLPVFTIHPKTCEKIWFNQATTYHASYLLENPVNDGMDYLPDNKLTFSCCYGDGSDIEPEVVQHIRDVIWQSSVGFQMKKGELLVFDNLHSQHGRIGYTGERKLYVNLITS